MQDGTFGVDGPNVWFWGRMHREQKRERRWRERPPDSMRDQARLDVPALVQDTYNVQHLAACAVEH